jgi:hypothetical protein
MPSNLNKPGSPLPEASTLSWQGLPVSPNAATAFEAKSPTTATEVMLHRANALRDMLNLVSTLPPLSTIFNFGAIPMNTIAQTMILNPPSNLLIGPAGTGKTWSIFTLLKCGLEVRMLATEHSAPNRVIEAVRKNVPDLKQQEEMLSRFDWKFISPAPPKWQALMDSADMINRLSLDDIAKQRTGVAKGDAKQWIELLNTCAEFHSDKDGQILGDVTEWGPDCAFVIDGLTGVNTMSRNLTVGLKPNPAPGEWGVMQGNILTLINKLASDCKCFFVCIAHVERETNEVTGISQVTVSTIGAKLAPKLPPLFTNVIYAVREKDQFRWSTAALGVDTKAGDLPILDNLPPDFTPIVESYRARVKAATPAAPVPGTQP